MKNFFKKLWAILTDPKNEKAVLITLPCIAVLVAALILTPSLIKISRHEPVKKDNQISINTNTNDKGSADKLAPKSKETPAAKDDKVPQTSPEVSKKQDGDKDSKTPDKKPAKDKGTKPESGKKPESKPTPASKPTSKPTPKPTPAPTPKPTPKPSHNPDYEKPYDGGPVEHVEIENVADVITIIDDTELPYEEQVETSAPSAPVELDIEVIETPAEAQGQDNIIIDETPVLDANGNQTYKYTVNLGPNGRILLRDSGEESEVYPVDEDGDGEIDYGEYFLVPSTPEEGTESGLTAEGYYVSESLYNADNTPVEKYDITAEPVMDSVSRRVGWQENDGRMYYYNEDGETVKGLKKIDGVLYYFDQNGVKASSLGIDVSSWDEEINWQAVKAQGIDYAIIRVGGRGWESGKVYNDTMYKNYMKGAKAAGLKVGVYFYSTAVNEREAVEEASFTLQRLNGQKIDLPVFIDMEYSGDRPNGRADNLTPEERTDIINAFCETVENSGYRAGVYSGQNFFHDEIQLDRVNRYYTWLASYTENNRLPDFRGRYDMWQFTSSGSINGIEADVDLNVIF